ncbi:MAG: alpha-glucosidase [Lachnospiraceae bacterium]|nr:alpha-glucosidase [Lachnospiraceae bacterium]MBR4767949.1 alpha-glucosidase [Lachnospiraceae bacterium]
MKVSEFVHGSWSIFAGKRAFLLQDGEKCLVTAVRSEKAYFSDHGSVKSTVSELERVKLDGIGEKDGRIVLSGGGHSLTVEPVPEEGGVTLNLSGEPGWAYEFTLPFEDGEAIFGGGEQYRKVNLKGETVVNLVSEHIKAKTVIEKAVLPKFLYREKEHKDIGTYAPMPVFVTDRFTMILFDTPADGQSEFTSSDFTFSFDECPKSVTIYQGNDYRDLGRKLASRFPNREYLPDWCYDGMILGVQGGTETVLNKAFAMLDAGAKVNAVWCQDWSGENRTVMGKQVWWNWEADETLYPGLKDAIAKLNERGVRFLGYINPYLVEGSRLYKECEENNYLIRRESGEVYHIKSTTFNAGMLDLTHPEVVRFVKEKLIRDNMLSLGMSGWMADFGEYLPVDAVLFDGDPKELHNLWPVLWAKLNREAIEEFGRGDEFFFSRSGYLGVQTYAPILWNGDQHTDLTKDYGMPCIMPASFSIGFSGVTLVHSDIGGFFSFGKMHRNEELFTRWMEMNAFSVLMRSHESIRPWANAQFDAPKVVPYTVKLTNIHAALKPYLKHLEEEARSGIPAMRPDFYEEGRFDAGLDPYSYFLGDDLYVCPVIRSRVKKREVSLPKGDWIGFFDGKEYEGGSTFVADAPLGEPPIFYRKESRFADVFRNAAKE